MNFIAGKHLGKPTIHTLGIRPEDITISHESGLAATIQHIEQLGGDTNIIVQLDDHQITVRLFGQYALKKGQEINLHMPEAKLFYFDEQERRVGK